MIMKFQLLIKTNAETFIAFKLSNVVFILLINVKMPTIVGILIFMSMIHFMLSSNEHERNEMAHLLNYDKMSHFSCFHSNTL